MKNGESTDTMRDETALPLKGKVALVTGGSRGIGAAICRVFAHYGADIVTTYHSHPEGAEQVLSDVRATGQKALALQADVGDKDQVDRLFENAIDQMGRIDIAVANAAINLRYPMVDAPWESIEQTLNVTMYGALQTLRLGGRQMVKQGEGGKLIAISSIHAAIPFANSGAYNLAKAGINQLCRTLAAELAPHQITVNSIEPGWIDTEGERDRNSPEDFQRGIQRIPLGRLGKPEEVAKLAYYLASPDADFITGSIFRIDGGQTLVR